MNIVGIIPARMASSRFPGKPLAKIGLMPMVGHVYFRSKMSKLLNGVYLATCDEEIFDYARSIGAQAVMTKNTHKTASDRVAEAMLKIENERGRRIDVVVMIQGDEPLIYPEMIDAALKPICEDSRIQVVNLMSPLRTKEEHEDPNEVKVVVDLKDFAVYFSREPIPSRKKGTHNVPMFKQVCIIPFRRDFLIEFNALEPSPLEIIESVDMLRVIEHGYRVKMVLTKFDTYSVDSEQDLKKVAGLMEDDFLAKQYSQRINT